MSDQPSLFADLPLQDAPLGRETDEHVLSPCSRCRGTGRDYSLGATAFWDWWRPPVCSQCEGHGQVLARLGWVREAEWEAV